MPQRTIAEPAVPRSWADGESRPFAATLVDAGYLYLRPRLTLGYGKPFRQWVGVDGNPIVTSNGLGAYGGVRAAFPWFDVRAGARGFSSFQHEILVPRDHYSTADLNSTEGTPARYVTLEAELSGGIPAGPGSVLFVLTAAAVRGIPDGYYVYEETLRVITKPPAIYRARTGYALRLGDEGNARVGAVVEALAMPGRSAVVYRGGLIGSFGISPHIEVVGLLVLPLASPDSIGIAGGDYGELGIRYRWATGDTP